jgi:hypothetical protein
MTRPVTAADALKYAAAILKSTADWTTDAIAGSTCDVDHDTELDEIAAVVVAIHKLASQFGDITRYSDGRPVQTRAEIQTGLVAEHIWHPDATAEHAKSWTSALPADPGESSPGLYEVISDPSTQELHVRVVRMA